MTFEFVTEVAVRYTDIDSYGHVNNVTYGTYFEEARIDYLEAVVGREDSSGLLSAGEDGGTGIVIANFEVDYERPVGITDSVSVGVRVPHLGEKSFPIEYELRDDGAVAAVGETTVVAYDRDEGTSRPIPESWRDAIAEFEDL